MVPTEGYLKEKLDAETLTGTASGCGAIPGHRMERCKLVGEATAMCLTHADIEELVAGTTTVCNLEFFQLLMIFRDKTRN